MDKIAGRVMVTEWNRVYLPAELEDELTSNDLILFPVAALGQMIWFYQFNELERCIVAERHYTIDAPDAGKNHHSVI